MSFQKTKWNKLIGTVKEGAGWYTAIGICSNGGNPFVRVARGRAIPDFERDETDAPIKQAQKFNIKSRERAEELCMFIMAAFDEMEGQGQ